MNTIKMKTGGYAIYEAPPRLKTFLIARESGTASKELLMQLSAEALAEQEVKRSKAPARRSNLSEVVIDFNRARRGARD